MPALGCAGSRLMAAAHREGPDDTRSYRAASRPPRTRYEGRPPRRSPTPPRAPRTVSSRRRGRSRRHFAGGPTARWRNRRRGELAAKLRRSRRVRHRWHWPGRSRSAARTRERRREFDRGAEATRHRRVPLASRRRGRGSTTAPTRRVRAPRRRRASGRRCVDDLAAPVRVRRAARPSWANGRPACSAARERSPRSRGWARCFLVAQLEPRLRAPGGVVRDGLGPQTGAPCTAPHTA